MILPVACLLLIQPRPFLGRIAIVKVGASITPPGGRPSPLPIGQVKGKVAILVGDVVTVRQGGAVKGVYDGKLLVLSAKDSPWTAPKRGEFEGEKAAGTILGHQNMGPGDGKVAAYGFFPPEAEKHWLYVDSAGTMNLAWTMPPEAKAVTVTVWTDGKRVGSAHAAAHQKVDGVDVFGWIESRDLGLALRRASQEDATTPLTIELVADTGTKARADWLLVSKEKAREWDAMASALAANLAVDRRDSGEWFESWSTLLSACEEDSPALAGFWVVKAWSTFPSSYAANDAVLALANKFGQRQVDKLFSQRLGERP